MSPRKEQRLGMRGRARRSKTLGSSDPRTHRDPQATYKGDVYLEPLYVNNKGELELRIDGSTSPALEVGPDGLRFQESAATVLPTTAFAVEVGNNSDTSIVVTHSLGTRDVAVEVRLAASTYDRVDVPWQATSTSTITLLFAVAPTASQYRCVVQKG